MPGCTRPARPVRCCADACEMGVTNRLLTPERASKERSLANPQSITYLIRLFRYISVIYADWSKKKYIYENNTERACETVRVDQGIRGCPYTMPGIVSEVSATLVATTTLRTPCLLF